VAFITLFTIGYLITTIFFTANAAIGASFANRASSKLPAVFFYTALTWVTASRVTALSAVFTLCTWALSTANSFIAAAAWTSWAIGISTYTPAAVTADFAVAAATAVIIATRTITGTIAIPASVTRVA